MELEETRLNYGFPDNELREACYNRLNNWVACYFQVQKQVGQLLDDYYHSLNENRNAIALPVPITEIAQWLGFGIQRKSLNRTRNANLGMVLGRLEQTSDKQWNIFLEEEYNLTYEQERYATANLLGQFYVGKNLDYAECAEVRLPSDNGEIMSMLFTAFLALPPKALFNAADKYADIEKRPISQELMLLALSKQAQIPYYHTVVCYEYLRVLASYSRDPDFQTSLSQLKGGGETELKGIECRENNSQPDTRNGLETAVVNLPSKLATDKFFF